MSMTTDCAKCGAPMPPSPATTSLFGMITTVLTGYRCACGHWNDLKRRNPHLSPKQKRVINHCDLFGSTTLEQAVEIIGGNLYANAHHHVGALLSNMVKRGLLVREKRGVFVLPKEVKP